MYAVLTLSLLYESSYECALVGLILDLSDVDGLSSATKRPLLSSNNDFFPPQKNVFFRDASSEEKTKKQKNTTL